MASARLRIFGWFALLLTLFASAPHFHFDAEPADSFAGPITGDLAEKPSGPSAEPARVAEATSLSNDRDHDEHDAFPETNALPCGVCRSADETHLAAGRDADVWGTFAARREPAFAWATAPRGPARSAHPTRAPPRLA